MGGTQSERFLSRRAYGANRAFSVISEFFVRVFQDFSEIGSRGSAIASSHNAIASFTFAIASRGFATASSADAITSFAFAIVSSTNAIAALLKSSYRSTKKPVRFLKTQMFGRFYPINNNPEGLILL